MKMLTLDKGRQGQIMKKLKILTKPTRITTTDLNELLYDDKDWEAKAERLQIRRWRKLREEMM
jgi:hypothetical protein